MWTQDEQDKQDQERRDEIEKGGWIAVIAVFTIAIVIFLGKCVWFFFTK